MSSKSVEMKCERCQLDKAVLTAFVRESVKCLEFWDKENASNSVQSKKTHAWNSGTGRDILRNAINVLLLNMTCMHKIDFQLIF